MRLVGRGVGNAWTELDSASLAAGAYAIHVTPKDEIYIGTGWTNIWPGAGCAAFRWDGAAWQNIGYFDGGSGPFVSALEPAPGGGMYAAGRFLALYINGVWVTANYIAIYTPPLPLFTEQPRSVTICPAGPATLRATAVTS